MKRWLGIGIAGVVVIGIGLFFLVSSLDKIITHAVETFGTDITQVKVSLDKTEISPSTGKGALIGLTIGNPKGFHTAKAFELGEVSLAIDVDSITKPTVVINEIVIASPGVTYELGSSGSNIDAIKSNVDSYVNSFKKAGGSTPQKSSGGDEKKLIIKKFVFRGGKVNVSATALKGETLTVNLPDIQLNDIGKQKGGASPSEVAEKIFASLQKQIKKVVNPLDLGQAKKMIEGIEINWDRFPAR